MALSPLRKIQLMVSRLQIAYLLFSGMIAMNYQDCIVDGGGLPMALLISY